MIRRAHPSARTLRRWLSRGHPEWVEHHVGECEHCTQLLEAKAGLPDAVRETLADVTEPPADLPQRMTHQMAAATHRLDALTTLVELLAVGWQAPLALLDEPHEGEQ